MKMKVLLASNNGHKIKEIKEILGDFFDVVSLREAGVESDPEETGATFEENARIKAVAGMKASGMPCIADDSGLEVFALDGLPGVMSARYAGGHGDDSANNEKLLRELENASDRSARYVCVICMAFPNGHEIGKTFAEITAEEKNEVSHRKAALKEFEKIWEKENG